MIIKKILAALAIITFFANCSKKDEIVFENGFDQIEEWGFHNIMLVNSESHSKNYSCRIDKKNEYSFTFKQKASDISKKKLKSVEIEVWLKISDFKSKSSIVFTADSANGNPAFWFQQPTDFLVTRTNEWTKTTAKFDIPEVENNTSLIIYIWQKSEGYTLVDDFKISFREY